MSEGETDVTEKVEAWKQLYREGKVGLGKMEFEIGQLLGEEAGVSTAVSSEEIFEYEEKYGEPHPVFHVDYTPTRGGI